MMLVAVPVLSLPSRFRLNRNTITCAYTAQTGCPMTCVVCQRLLTCCASQCPVHFGLRLSQLHSKSDPGQCSTAPVSVLQGLSLDHTHMGWWFCLSGQVLASMPNCSSVSCKDVTLPYTDWREAGGLTKLCCISTPVRACQCYTPTLHSRRVVTQCQGHAHDRT